MPPETELIKQQMGQTRASLTEKLETLETKVFSTVGATTDTVAQTVHEVGATVRETAQDVRATMHETMDSMRDALDLSQQMHQHPWLMLGGSVLAGYVGGLVLDNLERGRMPSLPIAAEQLLPRSSEVRERVEAHPPAQRTGSSFFRALAESFAPELDKLKRAALGMAMGVVREKISESVPPHLREHVTELVDRVTVKLGGEPPPPGAMSGRGEQHQEGDGARMARSMG
ncbi:MAG TPA: hypothetical protein VMG10_14285 [Gemmataceae bacterium]|nr:hypothetical protein [Gemmataceae bacterium]